MLKTKEVGLLSAGEAGVKPIGEYSEVREAQAKLTPLNAELQRTETELRALVERMTAGMSIEDQARQILAGGLDSMSTDNSARLQDLRQRAAVLRKAVQIQEAELQGVRRQVTRRVATAVRPMYEKILQEMAAVAVRLGQLADLEAAFRDDLEQRFGFDSGWGGAITTNGLPSMRLSQHGTTLNMWLDDLERENGIRVGAKRHGPGINGFGRG